MFECLLLFRTATRTLYRDVTKNVTVIVDECCDGYATLNDACVRKLI